MKRNKGIYLGACKALHKDYDIVYQDIDGTRDLGGDMLEVDISQYDYIIATPPCNWWSQLNMVWYKSPYALKTRHLLPLIILRLAKNKKPFVVECVKNLKRYKENHILQICEEKGIRYQVVGRHVYFTNTNVDFACPQIQDFGKGGVLVNNDGYRQGGTNVHNCIEKFLEVYG